MYSNLGGTEVLNFHRNYKIVKAEYASLNALPNWVVQYIIKLGRVVEQFEKEGRVNLIAESKSAVLKANDDLQKAWKVKQAIDKWAAHWSMASAFDPTAINVVSGLPTYRVPAEAMAALTWIVNHGMAVQQEYKTKRFASEAVIKKAIEEDEDIAPESISDALIRNAQYIMYGGIAIVALLAFRTAWRF